MDEDPAESHQDELWNLGKYTDFRGVDVAVEQCLLDVSMFCNIIFTNDFYHSSKKHGTGRENDTDSCENKTEKQYIFII